MVKHAEKLQSMAQAKGEKEQESSDIRFTSKDIKSTLLNMLKELKEINA